MSTTKARGFERRKQAASRMLADRCCAGALSALVAMTCGHAAAATFDCVINPSLTVKLGSPVTSVLSEVLVDRGDVVKKGEPVARIESSVDQAVVAINQARAASTAEIEAKEAVLEQKDGILKRKLELQLHNNSSAQDVDNARTDFNVAQQELVLAKLNRQMAELELKRSEALLEQRTIRSPIDGIVTQRSLGPGEYVRPDADIISVARIDPLNIEAYVPVRYYGRIKVGDTATVRPDDPIGGDRKAEVSVVDQVFDAASGTFGVRLSLPNADASVPGGLRCRVTFDVPEMAARASDSAGRLEAGPSANGDSSPPHPTAN